LYLQKQVVFTLAPFAQAVNKKYMIYSNYAVYLQLINASGRCPGAALRQADSAFGTSAAHIPLPYYSTAALRRRRASFRISAAYSFSIAVCFLKGKTATAAPFFGG